MRDITPVEFDIVTAHLKAKGTGVSLNRDELPKPRSDYKAFRGLLDESDMERLFLYWEFREHTHDNSGKLLAAMDALVAHERVKSFIEGDSQTGRQPVDLRSSSNFELVIVSDDIERGFLYTIDGNHRILAQHLSGKGIHHVPAFVVQHPKMLDWAYVPDSVREWRMAQ